MNLFVCKLQEISKLRWSEGVEMFPTLCLLTGSCHNKAVVGRYVSVFSGDARNKPGWRSCTNNKLKEHHLGSPSRDQEGCGLLVYWVFVFLRKVFPHDCFGEIKRRHMRARSHRMLSIHQT